MNKKREKKGMTYTASGVNIKEEGSAIKSLISSLGFRRQGKHTRVDLGPNFSGLIDFGDHYLSLCTDGVGSKIIIAETLQKWDTVGIDCIAMNVNDMICIGAEPIAFVDYIAAENPTPEILHEIGRGLDSGARLSNIEIIGGETATLPDIINGLDLAGTCLGWVQKEDLITGGDIKPGDLIVGFPSSGIHSNGFSLVRKVVDDYKLSLVSPLQEMISSRQWKSRKRFREFKAEVEIWVEEEGGGILGEILLTPTKIYVKDALDILKNLERGMVKGMANITGGGVRNVCRMKPDVGYEIDEPLPVPPVFRMIQIQGLIEEEEMYQTFNMGTGFVMVIDPSCPDEVMRSIPDSGAKVIGRVKEGSGVSIPGSGISFKGYP